MPNNEHKAGDINDLASSRFAEVPIEITISVGIATPPVRELLTLKPGTVFPLNRAIEDPVDLFISNRLIGRGQLEEIESGDQVRLGVRITEVVPPSNEA